MPESKEKKWLYSSSKRFDGQKAGRSEAVNIAAAGGTVCAGEREKVLTSLTQMVSICQAINYES